MGIKNYIPVKSNTGKLRFFDQLADPYFHQGDDVGCAVLHGFTGTPANVRVVADAIAGAGHTVIAPCLSGHATSLRDMDAQSAGIWKQDALSAHERLISAGCKHIFMMGLSMGGILASLVAQERPCEGLVLMSVPFIMQKYLHRAKRLSRILPYIVSGGDTHIQLDSYKQGYSGAPLRKLHDLDHLTLQARGGLYKITCPTLILQSAGDRRVDPTSVPLAQNGIASKDITTIMLYNSPHACTVGPEKELVAQHCLEFVQRVMGAHTHKA